MSSRPAPSGAPIRFVDGVPMYAAGEAPADLLTSDQLREQRLRPARGQRPAAYVNDHPDAAGAVRLTRLYDPAAAERMRALSPGQQRAMAARRTCPQCGTVGTELIRRDVGVCADCAEAACRRRVEERQRACTGCGRPATRPYPAEERRCTACALYYALWEQGEAGRAGEWARTCPGCAVSIRLKSAPDMQALDLRSFTD